MRRGSGPARTDAGVDAPVNAAVNAGVDALIAEASIAETTMREGGAPPSGAGPAFLVE